MLPSTAAGGVRTSFLQGETMGLVKRATPWRRGVALVIALGVVAGACGGDDDDDAATTDAPSATEAAPAETSAPAGTTAAGGSTAAPTGEPIKLLTVTTLNANGPTYENIAITAELAAQFINENG